ncbi:MAG: hypothetical protein KAT75_12000 [Dehalococcoidia bacterium]|nr:hypothetical protein [Dehalococcoidia bacterium]
MIKGLCLLGLIVPLLLVAACIPAQDVPAYVADEVMQVAKVFSPDCRIRIGVEQGGS